MMLHHVSVGVRDVAKSAAFYDKVLKALGYKRVMEVLPYAVAYGDKTPEFWIGLPHDQKKPSVGNGAHISFAARNKAAVNAFHAVALANGGKDDGAPGPRPDYGPDYYGAFCRDIDGNKIEAVIVKMPAAAKKPAKKTKRR
jgi:catechol 2,3-dioxygenase-like lactoylglutathione lyase family enzyme